MKTMAKQEREESKIKEECLEDLQTASTIVSQSKHHEAKRILKSLETIQEFCQRWWEI